MGETAVRTQSTGLLRASRKLILWIGIGLVILLVVVYLGIGAIAASKLTLPVRVTDPINPGMYNLAYEDFNLPARGDGLQIAAWYIPSDRNQRAIVLVHGRDDSRTHGFVDQFVPFARMLHDFGFSVLMIDLRGHGASADSRYHFGIKERLDVLGAVDWLEKRGYQPGKIGVLGYSLGAASVIGAASEEQDIGAIWIDSSYADIKSVLEHIWTSESGLPQVLLTSTVWMTRLLYGYDITASRPVDEIGKIAPRPIFVAHCKSDNMIPISHMDRLLAAAKNTQTWVIQNCDQHTLGKDLVPEKYNNHAIGYDLQPEKYSTKVINFFDESLK
ncbi:MAG: alpha/beta hydrolase [Omnitrophica WOR_2 bacterium]